MSVTTTTVRINSNNLGANATLVLVFDVDDGNQNNQAYKNFYPFVQRVGTFSAKGNYALTLPFVNQLSFVKPEDNFKHPGHDDDDDHDSDVFEDYLKVNARTSGTWVYINPGQTTTLTQGADSNYAFSDPTSMGTSSQSYIQAINQCSLRKDIVVGSQNPKGQGLFPQPVWSFPNVGVGSNVTTQFTPIVRAYIGDGYYNNQLIKEPFPTPPIWTQDLRDLPGANTTDFMLTWEPSTGAFVMNQCG